MSHLPEAEEVQLNVLKFWVSYRQQREACPPFDFDREREIIHTTLRELDALCEAYQKLRYRTKAGKGSVSSLPRLFVRSNLESYM